MTEQFVPYEIAIKLKEKGFDEPCFGTYNSFSDFIQSNSEYPLNKNSDKLYDDKWLEHIQKHFPEHTPDMLCTAPLWQQAIDWFEDKHNIILSRNINYSSLNGVLVHVGHNYRLSRVGMVGDPIFTKECPSRIESSSEAIEHALTLLENFSK